MNAPAPEFAAPPSELQAPAPPPPGPPNPDLQALDLLNQAFNDAGQLGEVVLAGKIGGAMSRLGVMIADKMAMQANLDAANKKWLALDARAVAQDAEIEACHVREK